MAGGRACGSFARLPGLAPSERSALIIARLYLFELGPEGYTGQEALREGADTDWLVGRKSENQADLFRIASI
jgi:hypothetical protein